MRRKIAIVLLSLGAIAGYGAGFAQLMHDGRHGCHSRWHHGANE